MAQHEAHGSDRPLPIEDYGLIGDGPAILSVRTAPS
jgi:hypothetical protein